MKALILLVLFVTFAVLAQTPEEAARNLEVLIDPSPEVTCDKHLMTPDEALAELNSPDKTWIGRKNLYGHDQNYTCIYKTTKAYILYHNCMSNKRETNALDIEVIPFTGDIFGFAMENNQIGVPSTLKRSQYNMNWQVSIQVTDPPGRNLSVDQLNSFLSKDPLNGSCFVGGTFKARDMSLKAQCSDRIKNANTAEWEEKATSFWREPKEAWYQALKESRRRMTSF
jgi:hypothetical protein